MRSKKSFLNLITNIIKQLLNIASAFIIPHILISKFGTEVYGLSESIIGFLAFITLLEAGFGPVIKASLYKAIAKKKKDKIEEILGVSEKFFKRIAIIFLVYTIGLSIIYPIINSPILNYVSTSLLIIVIAISTFSEYFFGITYRLFLQADQKSYITNIIQIISILLNLALVFIAANSDASIIIIKIVTGIAYIIRPLLQNYYVKKKYGLKPEYSNNKFRIEQKWDALAHHVAFMVHSKTDVVVLTLLSKIENVAIYSVYALILDGIKTIVCMIAESFTAAFGDMIAKRETDTLRTRFNSFETIFFSITTAVYACTIPLITPFIQVYTKEITDVDYQQPIFGCLLTIGIFILTIRHPYNELVKAAGHFKQTRPGAIIEAIINIVLSVILVWKFGLIGVAIGTLVAMIIRTTEFVYYSNIYILKRSLWPTIKKILFTIAETLTIVFIYHYLPLKEYTGYMNWAINAIIIAAVAFVVTFSINFIFFKKEFLELGGIIKRIAKKKH